MVIRLPLPLPEVKVGLHLQNGPAERGTSHLFHLGTVITFLYSYVHPFSFVQVNINGTANILNACLEVGTESLVTTSTSEVYGTAVTSPMDETHTLHPQSPYATSKASADHLAQSYERSFELPVVIVRLLQPT